MSTRLILNAHHPAAVKTIGDLYACDRRGTANYGRLSFFTFIDFLCVNYNTQFEQAQQPVRVPQYHYGAGLIRKKEFTIERFRLLLLFQAVDDRGKIGSYQAGATY